MKKIFLPVFILTYVVILAGIGILQTGTIDSSNNHSLTEYIFIGVISILFLIGIILSIKRYRSEKQGLPVDDEMSIKIVNKSASYSYYLSLFLWLVIIFIQSRTNLVGSILMGYGIIGMATTFILCFIYFNFKGVKN